MRSIRSITPSIDFECVLTFSKPKVVVHIDEFGSADPLPITGGPPYVIIRVQPMAGDLSRYTVTSTDPHDDSEEDIVQTARVAGRVVQTSKLLSKHY
jgi:hypothetical protein